MMCFTIQGVIHNSSLS